ncbi:unnamed protein product, partial [Rotaria magnacalcarata]
KMAWGSGLLKCSSLSNHKCSTRLTPSIFYHANTNEKILNLVYSFQEHRFR